MIYTEVDRGERTRTMDKSVFCSTGSSERLERDRRKVKKNKKTEKTSKNGHKHYENGNIIF